MLHRPPELLVLARSEASFGPEVDMWAVGCLLVEALHGPLMWHGHNCQLVLRNMQQICGSLPGCILSRRPLQPWCDCHNGFRA